MSEDTEEQAGDVARLAALFEGFVSAHGTHGVPEKDPDGLKWNIKRTARTVRKPVTPDLWRQHVAGQRPLGVIPIREDNTCSWGSIDYDVYDENLIEIVGRVLGSGLPLVPCVSKSGGLHLFLFLEKPEPAADVQGLLRDAAASLGMAGSEIFPKQIKVLLERSDLGNWMVMPYYGDTYGGKLRLQHGLKKTGAEMTLREFVTAAEQARTTVVKMAKLCEGRRAPAATKAGGGKGGRRRAGGPSPCDFTDGPPCLQHLVAQGVQTDGRKRTLFMMALYYKRADSDGWRERVEQANNLFFNPPLPAEEVLGVVRSVGKKDYEYTCKEEPMRSHCDSTACRMRKLGVGRASDYPVITAMRKLDTEPPVWFVDVEGGETLELSTEELQRYDLFQRACLWRLNRFFAPLKNDVWVSIISEALERVDVQKAPYEIGVLGRFHAALVEFLTNRSRGERFEDLFSGRPWECVEEDKHYFRVSDLKKFLDREKFKPELSEIAITRRVVKLGGGKRYFSHQEPRVRTWWVPSSAVRGETAPAIDPPKLEEDDL